LRFAIYGLLEYCKGNGLVDENSSRLNQGFDEILDEVQEHNGYMLDALVRYALG
jgi:hypothetical protein